MKGLLKEGNKVWLSKSNNPDRKLKYTLQIIEVDSSKVGVNTHLTNKIVLDALKNNIFSLLGIFRLLILDRNRVCRIRFYNFNSV